MLRWLFGNQEASTEHIESPKFSTSNEPSVTPLDSTVEATVRAKLTELRVVKNSAASRKTATGMENTHTPRKQEATTWPAKFSENQKFSSDAGTDIAPQSHGSRGRFDNNFGEKWKKKEKPLCQLCSKSWGNTRTRTASLGMQPRRSPLSRFVARKKVPRVRKLNLISRH